MEGRERTYSLDDEIRIGCADLFHSHHRLRQLPRKRSCRSNPRLRFQMNISAIKRLRAKLAADEPVYGLWITLESPSISEMAVALGVDWLVVDAEHGPLDWKDISEHIRAAVRSDTVVLVRIAELSGGLIKRALDIGADGVVVPWVESAEQLRQAIAFARYPT